MKTDFVALAQSLGFDACRVASCDPPAHAREFGAWLEAGHAADMEWIVRGRDKRCDPQLVLPGARSVIVLAMNYWQGGGGEPETRKRKPENGDRKLEAGNSSEAERGRVARYAWGDDYHEVIERKLKVLDEFLQAHGGVQKCYVDTGPVLERDFAAAAGIGWHGKSTMLLNAEFGTWFFLAEIFTTLELSPDPPQRDRCGTCTRCIDACPTGAITAPHILDARLCISWLTIENKGPIPESLRPLIGDRIYGCDECLEVCPWNRFAQVSRESAFAAREFVGMPLRELLALDGEAFRALFRKSPVKRIKRRGLLRNVCVALGNVGGPQDIPALERAAQDPEELVAEHARWALKQIRSRTGSL